jgi:uncharacterized protein (TIGR03437 family)
MVVTTPATLVTPPVITIGGMTAQVGSANLTAAGLYTFSVTVPASAPNGDIAVVAQVGGQMSPNNAVIAVER